MSASALGVADLGYLFAQHKPVFGYSNAPSVYPDRVAPDGMFIEPLDLCDIVMAPGTVARSTGGLPTQPSPPQDTIEIGSLEVFTECVRRAAAQLLDPSD